MGDFIGVVTRHIGQMLGAGLVSVGVITEDQTGLVTGVVISLSALGWGICKAKGVKFCQGTKQGGE
jgi:hypothetical protein